MIFLFSLSGISFPVLSCPLMFLHEREAGLKLEPWKLENARIQ